MSKSYVAPVGTPCWYDLGTSDKDKSKAFYTELFGWTYEDGGEEVGGYTTAHLGGEKVAGMMANDGSMGPDSWFVYFKTDDVAKLREASVASGGEAVMDPMPISDLGTMVFVNDNGGAFIGAWEAGEHTGFGIRGDHHGAPGWFELHTREWEQALDFYRSAFGCTIEVVSDADEFRYAIVMDEGEQSAGIMDASAWLPEGVPAHWSVYFATDSADATIAKAVQLGATVVQGAEDTPYGRLATLTDPTGATFKLVENIVEQ